MKKVVILFTEFVCSIVVPFSVLYGGYYMCDSIPLPPSNELGDKLIFYIRCCVFPCAVFLFFSILDVASIRGSSAAANPLSGNEHLLQVQKNCLMNTVEQTLVFLMTALTLTSFLEASEMKILPLYAILWLLGRVLFRIGYGVNQKWRGFGMLTNVFSSAAIFVVLFYLAFTRGFLSSAPAAIGGGTGPRSDEL